MMSIGGSWARAAESSAGLTFVDANLRGAGQVMLQNNPLTGLLFLVGIGWGAVSAGTPQVAVGALVGLVVATATALWLRVDPVSLGSGLYGFNGILVGVALPTFLATDWLLWAYLVFGAGISVVLMLAVERVMKTWNAAALTFPFVLTTWILLLAAYSFGGFRNFGLLQPGFPHGAAVGGGFALGGVRFVHAVLRGVSQVFLIGNAVTGAIFLVALLVNSVWAAVFALVASVLAVGVALALGADSSTVAAGLFGFSPVLTAIAVGTVFYSPRPRVVVYAAVATIATVLMQAALNAALMPVGLPALTAPFVVVTWLFLLPRLSFTEMSPAKSAGG